MTRSLKELAAPFEWLGDLGFVGPSPEKNRANPTLHWLGAEIGIELELDSREEGLYLLLVRLEKGRLPDGYYVSHGKPCRVHLVHAISSLNLLVDDKALERVRMLGRARNHAASHWSDLSQAYGQLLRSCIDQILADTHRAFESAAPG